MKLTVRCRSGLRIDFEGTLDELERFDGFLAELARLERERLAPAPAGELARRIAEPFEPSPDTDPSPHGAVTPAAEPKRARVPGSGRRPTTAPVVLAAVEELGITTARAICERTGLTAKAVQNVLTRLKAKGELAHNGERGTAARWAPAGTRFADPDDEQFAAGIDALSRAALTPAPPADDEPAPPISRKQSPHEATVIGVAARAQMDAQRDERHDGHRDQVLALVAEHGPVAPAWVADQLVKNRRDTIALMRDMAAAGELVETDGYFNVPDSGEEVQAA